MERVRILPCLMRSSQLKNELRSKSPLIEGSFVLVDSIWKLPEELKKEIAKILVCTEKSQTKEIGGVVVSGCFDAFVIEKEGNKALLILDHGGKILLFSIQDLAKAVKEAEEERKAIPNIVPPVILVA